MGLLLRKLEMEMLFDGPSNSDGAVEEVFDSVLAVVVVVRLLQPSTISGM